jgi:hypothetical protein
MSNGGPRLKFAGDDYPALFRAADRASTSAQKKYVRLTGGILALLVSGAGLTATSTLLDSHKSFFAVTSVVLLAVSLALSTYLKFQAPERTWYGGRAIAESVKSMAWRYMTGTAPYPINVEASQVDTHFISDLESILKERRHLAFDFGGEFSDKPQISDRMRDLRAASLSERRDAYASERIADQKQWYGSNARRNRQAKNRYFVAVWLAQLLALLSAIALVEWPDSRTKLTGLFTSLASTLIAWIQVKQHQELAQSYAIAELELGFIEEGAKYVRSEDELSRYVTDSEKAISREHMLWIARRDRT